MSILYLFRRNSKKISEDYTEHFNGANQNKKGHENTLDMYQPEFFRV